MAVRNRHLNKLHASYLFAEVARKREEAQLRRPDRQIISLGIGDTVEPLPEIVLQELRNAVDDLGSSKAYTGYEPAEGRASLRGAIAREIYEDRVAPSEIFVSDGSKPDIGRLQWLFGSEMSVAVQDPSYPVYVDATVMAGRSGAYACDQGGYEGIVYLQCTAENGFFPDLDRTARTDLIYFCSPNNPTGAVATREQLHRLVQFARQNRSIILFDSAYGCFVRDCNLPRSIFEIDGADEVAIETGSLSKEAGFTGVRLGWTVVPEKLTFADGSSLHAAWKRVISTVFNGPSNLAQRGALAALSVEGRAATRRLTDGYLKQARTLKKLFTEAAIPCFGGEHAPYIWVGFPGRSSWQLFDQILEEVGVVTTPGSGFGPAGEGYVRLSSFATPEQVEEASQRLKEWLAQ